MGRVATAVATQSGHSQYIPSLNFIPQCIPCIQYIPGLNDITLTLSLSWMATLYGTSKKDGHLWPFMATLKKWPSGAADL